MTSSTTAIRDGLVELSDLDEQERYELFDRLQLSMPRVWDAMRLNEANESVVVMPSVTLDRLGTGSGSMTQAFEERFLFLLLLLREPRLRMIYVTSMPIASRDHRVLPGLAARCDSQSRPVAALARVGRATVHLGRSVRRCSNARGCSVVSRRSSLTQRCATSSRTTRRPSNVTSHSRWASPCTALIRGSSNLGTKTGCRRLFAEAGVQHPAGFEDLHTLDDVTRAVVAMRAQQPIEQVIVKLNEGVSGQGNALVELGGLPNPGEAEEVAAVTSRLQQMQFERPDTRLEDYLAKLDERGGIVEQRLTGLDFRSPSVQLRVIPTGEVELLSTHDQMLGGPSGQSYLGCRFPADFGYAAAISDAARIVGERLAREGVMGRFAIDFVAVREPRGCLADVCDRAQPAQGWDDSSLPDPAVPHRWPLRLAEWTVPDGRRSGEASGGDRSPGIAEPAGAHARRPVRHRRSTSGSFRSGSADRGGLSHDELPHRARTRRAHRRREQRKRCRRPVPASGADPAGRGEGGRRQGVDPPSQ